MEGMAGRGGKRGGEEEAAEEWGGTASGVGGNQKERKLLSYPPKHHNLSTPWQPLHGSPDTYQNSRPHLSYCNSLGTCSLSSLHIAFWRHLCKM